MTNGLFEENDEAARPSNAQLAVQAVDRFKTWVNERKRSGDWSDYIRGGKLNRSEMADECDFGRSAWTQNPALAAELAKVEEQLADEGVLSASALLSRVEMSHEAATSIAVSEESARRAMAARSAMEKRVKHLEEQNATLRAENRELKDKLRRIVLAEDHLSTTGRTLPP